MDDGRNLSIDTTGELGGPRGKRFRRLAAKGKVGGAAVFEFSSKLCTKLMAGHRLLTRKLITSNSSKFLFLDTSWS